MSRLKNAAIGCALSLLAVAFTVATFEIALRWAGVEVRAKVRLVSGKGITFVPGSPYRHTKEGFSEGRFNAHGFRDAERTIAKPAGTFRVLVLGDSFVEALQVPIDQAFPPILERSLNFPGASCRVEVLAMGQSGFGTGSEYMRYLNFGADYDPDLVVVAFFTGNDFRDNSRFLSRDAVAYYFTLEPGGGLALDTSLMDDFERRRARPPGAIEWIIDHSRLASLVRERLYLLRQQRRMARDAAAPPGGSRAPLDTFNDFNIAVSDPGPRWQEAFAITRAILGLFKDAVALRGGRLVLVSFGPVEQIDEGLARETRDRFGVPLDFDRADRLLEADAAELGVPFLPLAPAMRARARSAGVPFYGFGASRGGHWNAAGHRVAADLIASFLVERGLVPRATPCDSGPLTDSIPRPSGRVP